MKLVMTFVYSHFSFNAYGGVSGVLCTCLARLYVLEEGYKQRMKNELKTILSNKELSEASLEEMILLHNFILEVLRMHPPVPVFFGRARLVLVSHIIHSKPIFSKEHIFA